MDKVQIANELDAQFPDSGYLEFSEVIEEDINVDDSLSHYGTPRHSGRYPWGSGQNPYQRENTWLYEVAKLKEKGITAEIDIARAMGMSTTEFRKKNSEQVALAAAYNIDHAKKLKEHGYSTAEIARKMGTNESNVRGWLKKAEAGEQTRASKADEISDILKDCIDNKGYIDVGKGVELQFNDPVSRGQLDTAILKLKEQGYSYETIYVEQAGMPGKYTTMKVLAPPGTTKNDIYQNMEKIGSVEDYIALDGDKIRVTEFPKSISSDRVFVRYLEDGGAEKDGVIELRRNVDDLSLGNSHYAQVRIAVDDGYYLKGMALYSDDIPDGYDILVNSNKSSEKGKYGSFKKMEVDKDGNIDEDLPFGARIKATGQYHYIDKNGEDQLGAINKVNEEGDWQTWSKTLSSQMLSKQNLPLIKRQLNLAYAEKQDEFDEIMSIDNLMVRERLLKSFADDCDSSAVDLKAAALPRQQSHVILPITDMKPTEVYAPNYENGEHVVLIRYPHGGVFEIPELVVNNKHETAKRTLGNAIDAIGINAKVAEQLSGADFDGDTVLVIPVGNKVRIKTAAPLKELEGFNTKSYKFSDAEIAANPKIVITNKQKQTEMGKVSNLITDMTLRGCDDPSELARAVRHSMVVIDSEKHKLNWKQSEIDNDIAQLKEKYQGGAKKGASTLISRASAEARVDEYKRSNAPDKETGEWIFTPTGRTYKKYVKDDAGNVVLDADGNAKYKELKRQTKTTKMAVAKDAFELSSGTPQEKAYAEYANALKQLANTSRKEWVNIKTTPVNKEAALIYSDEVASLKNKLTLALKNTPKERKAQVLASIDIQAKKKANPELKNDKDELKKVTQVALANARTRVGAKKSDVTIDISPREWEAIQNHAISDSALREILNNTDLDKIKAYATPRKENVLTNSQINIIKTMENSGYTTKEIATRLGCSTSTVNKYASEN